MKLFSLVFAMFVAICFLLTGCATVNPPPTIEQKVDLPRFMGDWYVVAGQLTWLEKEAYNGVESYALKEGGEIATTYTFRKGGFDGPVKTYHPSGYVFNHESNAEWRMQFVWPFKAAYLILFLDDEYRYTVIGEPGRKYLWIMARKPSIPDDVMKTILTHLEGIGYDVSKITAMPQRWPESE